MVNLHPTLTIFNKESLVNDVKLFFYFYYFYFYYILFLIIFLFFTIDADKNPLWRTFHSSGSPRFYLGGLTSTKETKKKEREGAAAAAAAAAAGAAANDDNEHNDFCQKVRD